VQAHDAGPLAIILELLFRRHELALHRVRLAPQVLHRELRLAAGIRNPSLDVIRRHHVGDHPRQLAIDAARTDIDDVGITVRPDDLHLLLQTVDRILGTADRQLNFLVLRRRRLERKGHPAQRDRLPDRH
jgi:hypothetical protein